MPPDEMLIDLAGTLRTQTPAQTLRLAKPIARRAGITRLANVTGLDVIGVPTWVAVRPLSKSLSVSQGKGVNNELAQASAIMECLELWHAEEFVPRGVLASIRNALDEPEVFSDPFLFPLSQASIIGPTDKFEWIRAENIFSGETRLIPRNIVSLDSSDPTRRAGPHISSSNGLASGNSLAEATLHAVLEVIERDQITFWLASQLKEDQRTSTRLDLSTIASGLPHALLTKIQSAGLSVAIWYASTTLALPVFVCTIYDDMGVTPYPQRASGHGCHPRKSIALLRAITEAAQSRLTHISGSRDDSGWSKYRDQLPANNHVNQGWVETIRLEEAVLDYKMLEDFSSNQDLNVLLREIEIHLNEHGIPEILRVNLTQADSTLAFCHVSIPGLEYNIKRENFVPSSRLISYLGKEPRHS